ncbi:facilitated trehalose transporter tret1-2 -like protein [Holotrichia oblita]|uniref:Facilitated trehalose transporter tret1-2 -like protein n=1 Tax=Holotrichia oblita TaxID=644536 RepID=A0ACB9TPN0_HOLOL|nr:facilitated trehalose transporter tret1-2 -like protein [Holotrichia oblita]
MSDPCDKIVKEKLQLNGKGSSGNKAPDKVQNWRQICAVCSAGLAAFSASSLFNWTSPAIPKLQSDEYPNINFNDVSYLSVIPPIATIITSPSYDYFLNKFGRKYTLLSVAVFHLISFILIAIATDIWIFYLSRVLFGVADVFMFGSLPVYISEVTTPDVRGTWGNIMVIFIFIAQFSVNAVGYYCSIPTTACIFAAAPLIFFATFIFMPETPYHYVMKEQDKEAEKSLRRLRGTKYVNEELEQITADVKRQLLDPGTFKDLFFLKHNRKAIFIVVLARMIQQFSGLSALSVYNQYIFKEAGQNINEGVSAMIFNSMLAISTICGPIFIRKFGTNLSMVISCLGSFITLIAEAIYFYVEQRQEIDLSFMNWFPLFGLVIYVIAFSIGLALVPTLLLGELFATNMRGHASCVMNIAFSIFISVATKLFHLLTSSFGMYVPFAFYGICAFAGIFLCYKFIPETKGKTLEEIQQFLKSKS